MCDATDDPFDALVGVFDDLRIDGGGGDERRDEPPRVANIVATCASPPFVVSDALVAALGAQRSRRGGGNMLRWRCYDCGGAVPMAFTSGTMIVAGARTLVQLEHAQRCSLRKLRSALPDAPAGHDDATEGALTLQNVVAHGRVSTVVDLHRLADAFVGGTYDHRRFPGASVRPYADDPKITVIAFPTGRYVVSGMRSLDRLDDMDQRVRALLARYSVANCDRVV